MNLGNFELNIVSDGTFWLDGGAMFGVVPKAIWERRTRSDEKNRIPLGMNCLLVRTDEKTLLIDTGCGFKLNEKAVEIYRIQHERTVFEGLQKLSVPPESIDLVINTHLHFDHCGGNTLDSEAGIVPAFPRAEYVVQRREFEDARNANERNRASYLSENWQGLEARRQLRLIDGEVQIVPGVYCVPTPGHTLGHQSILIESEGKSVFFIADLCPTRAHVPLPWIMGYDLFPLTTLETRKRVYRQASDARWIVLFEHDPQQPAGILFEEKGRWQVETINWNE